MIEVCGIFGLIYQLNCGFLLHDSYYWFIPIGDPEKGWFWAESKNLAHSVIGYHHRHLIREKMTLNTSVFEKCANTSPWGPKWAFRPNFQVFGCKIQFSGNKLAYIIIFVDDNLYLSVKEYHWTFTHNFWAL